MGKSTSQRHLKSSRSVTRSFLHFHIRFSTAAVAAYRREKCWTNDFHNRFSCLPRQGLNGGWQGRGRGRGGVGCGRAERLSTFIKKGIHKSQRAGKAPNPTEKPRKSVDKCVVRLLTIYQHVANMGHSQICKDQRLSALSKLYFKLQPGTIRTSRRGDWVQ